MNRDNASAIAVGVAVVVMIAGFGIYFNNPELNKKASSSALVPSLADQTVTKNIQTSGGNNVIPTTTATTAAKATQQQHIDKSQFKQAPDIIGISNYINSQPFKLGDLKGKVVLVDFWTYSCINCIRTIPYLNAWYEKYADQGLVIVGVHTPEFDFEKNPSNVQAAVEKFGIKYPVVQDNDRKTWSAYENRYWPHKYLVDDEGFVRYDHIGEGNYAETEKVIQSLLQERAEDTGKSLSIDMSGTTAAPTNPKGAQSVDFGQISTPELYFGYGYARDQLGNTRGFDPGKVVTYALAGDIPDRISNNPTNTTAVQAIAKSITKHNVIYLSGDWLNNPDNMELKSHTGKIALQYSAKSVNIVAGGTGKLSIYEDGHPIGSAKGTDINEKDGIGIIINGQRLYNIVSHTDYGVHTLIIDVTAAGDDGSAKGGDFQAYTFTFG